MKSTAASVVAYIEEQPPDWQPTHWLASDVGLDNTYSPLRPK